MRGIWKGTLEALIAAFFLWHVLAVAVYALPLNASDRYTRMVRQTLVPLVGPYILNTSQWQQWELFSPNPLRRVEEYTVEASTGDAWHVVQSLQHETIPWYRDADELKLLGRLHEGERRQLLDAYLRALCRTHHLSARSPIRMSRRYYIIPDTYPLAADLQPEWKSAVSASTVCL